MKIRKKVVSNGPKHPEIPKLRRKGTCVGYAIEILKNAGNGLKHPDRLFIKISLFCLVSRCGLKLKMLLEIV